MSEMVERVARAISAERWGRAEQFDMESDAWRDAHRDMARVAIAAMREPTQKMVDKGWYYAYEENALKTWRSMIDEALK